MKHTLSLLPLLLVLCLLAALLIAPAASAVSTQEWNAQCTSKMGSGATVYQVVPVTASSTDLSDGTTALKASGSVSAGAYVKRGGSITVDGTAYCSITYLSGGGTASGYVKQSLVRSATVSRYINATQRISVPEAIANDASAIYNYAVSKGYNADLNAIRAALGQSTSTATPGATATPSAAPTATGSVKPTATPAATATATAHATATQEPEVTFSPTPSPVPQADITFYAELANQGTRETVEIVSFGTVNTTIRFHGEKLQIPTRQLQCSAALDPDRALAIVSEPDTGSVIMHTRESSRSGIVSKVSHGSIVLVLQVGSKMSYVWCKGKSGYIENSSLYFHPLAADPEQETPQPAVLSYKGKTDGAHTVSILTRPKSGSRAVGKFKSGVYADVFASPKDGWYEVEAGGVRGYVQQKYVTLSSAAEEQ